VKHKLLQKWKNLEAKEMPRSALFSAQNFFFFLAGNKPEPRDLQFFRFLEWDRTPQCESEATGTG
jgi:hypothetical protein